MLPKSDNFEEDRLKIGVLGLGTSNLGVIEYLLARGFRFSLTVRSKSAPHLSSLPDGCTVSRILVGDDCLSDIDESFLFLSPSARSDAPELLRAKARGVTVTSDVALFFRKNSKTRVYAVTGTDGKSTTVTVLSEILSRIYRESALCGNIGKALSPLLLSVPEAAAVELSSFQLMSLAPKSTAALITNISENHLDWHKSFDEYISAKENIFKNAAWRATLADNPITLSLFKKYGADALFSLSKGDGELQALGARVRISLDGDFIMRNGERILSCKGIAAFGRHTLLNIMGAIAMLSEPVDNALLSEAIAAFRPLSHRAECVGNFGGIEFIDSSIDSTPMRTSVTLSSMKCRPVVILGGRGKGLSLAPLLDSLIAHSSGAVITGECREEIKDAIISDGRFSPSSYPFLVEDSFSRAVILAAELAGPGGTVLLSPAATSYDCFSDYKARGTEFLRIARSLDGSKR